MTTPAPHQGLAPAPSASRFYRPELDVLRFVAFLAVFTFHALVATSLVHFPGPQKTWTGTAALAMSSGMCLFFLLSSFLITTLLLIERDSTNTIDVRAFYVRRALRIWPLYFFFLALVSMLGAIHEFPALGPKRLLAFLAFSGNWYAAFKGDTASPAAPLWSISLEEQFYLLWPVVALIGGRRALIWASAATFPLAWISIAVMRVGYGRSNVLWFGSFAHFEYFGMGALLAVWLGSSTFSIRTTAARIALFVAGIALWIGGSRLEDRFNALFDFIAGYALVGVGCLLLLLGFWGISPRFIPRGLISLGKISYGLYVFHWISESWWDRVLQTTGVASITHPFLHFASRTALSLATTVAAASLSYRFLEMPFLKLKERFAVVRSRPA